MISAGIVTYNPQVDKLKENIDAVYQQVSKVFIVDNGSKNTKEIDFLIQNYDNVEINYLGDNRGIAAALNGIIKMSKEAEYKWALLLDQDSVVPDNIISEMKKVMFDKVAIITPLIDYHNGEQFDKSKDYIYMDRCITSASLTNVDICEELGGFDEKMFIDYVDFDYCKRVIDNGYKIVRSNKVMLDHELGEIEYKIILGKKIYLYNHSIMRTYYFSRNFVYYIRKNCNFKEGFHEIMGNYKWFLVKVLFEKKRFKKFTTILKGFFDGFRMKKG